MTISRRAILDAIIEAYQKGNPIRVATIVGEGRFEKVLLDSSTGEPWVREAERAAAAAPSRKSTAVASYAESGSEFKLAVETIRPKKALLVLGAGHVGQAV